MVVTEVWLEVKNGCTIVLDAETARKQHRRGSKAKRKAAHHASRHNSSNERKRKREAIADPENTHSDGDDQVANHVNLQLFADAQTQLQQEMVAAGFAGDDLPLSFGSTSSQPVGASSRKRQRQRPRAQQLREGTSAVRDLEVAVEPIVMEKVRVVFDSDGEIAERTVETVSRTVSVGDDKPVDGICENIDAAEPIATDAFVENVEVVQSEPSDAPEIDPAVFKFWKQRRSLFHRYDEGIQLDRESWYSVTPESIAEYIARRCACDVIVDPFSGCGGNIIQFAKTCKQVIAIEIDADKIRMAKANAAIYGVADRIEWIHGDALDVLPTLKADVVFLSPPWGGMNYNRSHFGVEEMMIGATSGVELFQIARRVAKNVVYYLPKTTPEVDLQALAPSEAVECEHIRLNGQLKVVNAYYGDVAFQRSLDGDGPSSHELNHNNSDQQPPCDANIPELLEKRDRGEQDPGIQYN